MSSKSALNAVSFSTRWPSTINRCPSIRRQPLPSRSNFTSSSGETAGENGSTDVASSRTIRHTRPRSSPARQSIFAATSSGTNFGCSTHSRYISATYSAPSGPVARLAGRNHVSLDARKSAFSRARRAVTVPPFCSMTDRVTRWPTGSHTKTLRSDSSPNWPPRYAVTPQADV